MAVLCAVMENDPCQLNIFELMKSEVLRSAFQHGVGNDCGRGNIMLELCELCYSCSVVEIDNVS